MSKISHGLSDRRVGEARIETTAYAWRGQAGRY